jgi:hypothetical protein
MRMGFLSCDMMWRLPPFSSNSGIKYSFFSVFFKISRGGFPRMPEKTHKNAVPPFLFRKKAV